MRKPLNSLLQNQNLRVRALSSKAVSLLGKFPDDEVVRDCGRNNKNGPLCTWTRGSHPEEETAQHRFLVPDVTALHEQTPDEKPGD
ncbi:hypothetical protein [Bradyrhizobium liaoningense]|uniref:hypothetical protein n=1 Tax=Bradyrhizobium liaoningense TaxID=43992 RepID=UPI001BA8A189|nr:hypothetical protein [Bradyrhizobium liaoningense]MBR0823045.1 hypothetical protein [Bradyrhizobium liaoningense]